MPTKHKGGLAPATSVWTQTPLLLRLAMMASAIATLSIALRPQAQLLWYPFIEDAYYAFSVSRNIAAGNGFSVDGESLTNGFQPLATVVYAIPFLGPLPDIETLRVILILQWVTLMTTAWLVGMVVRTYAQEARFARYAFAIGFLAFLGSLFVINTALNGLETGTLLLGYAAMWRFMQVRGVSSSRNAAWFGLISGLVGLIRIDSLIVTSVVIVGILFAYGLRSALVTSTVTAVVVLPWLIYGLLLTGNPIPSSGRAQTAVELSTFRLERILEALGASGFPWLPISTIAPGVSTVLRLGALAALVIFFLILRKSQARSSATRRTEMMAGLFTIGVLVLAAYYGTTSFAFWFYGRYLAPLVLVSSFLLSMVLVYSGKRLITAGALILAGSAVAASIAHWIPGLYQKNTMYTEQVALVQSTVPPNQRVAATQTGTLGFFRPGTVNLDGKVNNDVLEFDGSIDEYLQTQSITWMCDWPRQLEAYLEADFSKWTKVSDLGEYVCIKRDTASSD